MDSIKEALREAVLLIIRILESIIAQTP